MRDCPHWPDCGCGTQSGPHTCEWRNRDKLLSEAATFLDRLAERLDNLSDIFARKIGEREPTMPTHAAECRAEAAKLRSET